MNQTNYSDLYTSAQVRAIDQAAIATGIPGLVLVERAANAAWACLHARWPDIKSVVIVCGSGNNGADGMLLAAIAHQNGLDVSVYCTRLEASLKNDAFMAAKRVIDAGLSISSAETLLSVACFPEDCVFVDALLGTGFEGDLKPAYAKLIDYLNNQCRPIFALDIASGLNADTGHAKDKAIQANATITFVGVKRGLLTGLGRALSGQLYYDALNIPVGAFESVITDGSCIHAGDPCIATLQRSLHRYDSDHKGRWGHVAVIGGDYGCGGAVLLSTQAALRSGAGTVSLHTREEHRSAALNRIPEAMTHVLDDTSECVRYAKRAAAIAIGPGLGLNTWGVDVFNAVMGLPQPKVIDADALNILAQQPQFLSRQDTHVFTPHPGEAARLLHTETSVIQADRFTAAKALQQRLGGVVVLKGAGTIIQARDQYCLCTCGNPGMAVGGMGDVLTGIIAALLAQGLGAFDAARLGVYLHSYAADTVASETGMIGICASDLIPEIRKQLNANNNDIRQ